MSSVYVPSRTANRLWALPGAMFTGMSQPEIIEGRPVVLPTSPKVDVPRPSFLIEHDRGLTLFDTGVSPKGLRDPEAYFPDLVTQIWFRVLTAPHGVNVNCIWPGLARTGLVEHFADDWRSSGLMSTEERDQFLSMAQPPLHLAPLVAFLCTDAARPITGHTFSVNSSEIRLVRQPVQDAAISAGGSACTVDDVAAQLPGMVPIEALPSLGFGWSRRSEPLG